MMHARPQSVKPFTDAEPARSPEDIADAIDFQRQMIALLKVEISIRETKIRCLATRLPDLVEVPR